MVSSDSLPDSLPNSVSGSFSSSSSNLAFLMVTESSTAFATLVSVLSLKEQCNASYVYHVHILSVGLTEEQEQAFKDVSEAGFQVQTYAVDSDKTETHPRDIAGILRLQLANIFWEIPVALYMDAYALVQGPVQELFTQDLGEKFAALATLQGQHSSKVMLLHLEYMREAKTVAELMACNVAKGDFLGYEQALEKVLGPKAVSMNTAHVCTESGHGTEYGTGCATGPYILCLHEEHALWQAYATRVCADHTALVAHFVPIDSVSEKS